MGWVRIVCYLRNWVIVQITPHLLSISLRLLFTQSWRELGGKGQALRVVLKVLRVTSYGRGIASLVYLPLWGQASKLLLQKQLKSLFLASSGLKGWVDSEVNLTGGNEGDGGRWSSYRDGLSKFSSEKNNPVILILKLRGNCIWFCKRKYILKN